MSDTTPKTNRNYKSLALIAGIVLLAAGSLGGYALGAQSDKSTDNGATVSSLAARASATGHNSADVTFTQQMVPHHSQALDMAKMAATQASSADVKTLASTIEAAQQPEIDTMNGWLSAWNADSGQSSSSMSMSDSMMSQADMSKLQSLNGAAFDEAFLTMMIKHHTGAVQMAETELRDGQNADALALAASIQVTQQAQITQMHTLLK